jgi:7-carboxy-7-deazaguanine synthase
VTDVPTSHTLVLAETFGATVQGEGPNAGTPASFIRTGGCDLSCSWCDSGFTWDGSRFDLRAELSRRPVADVAAEVLAHDTPLVVITGGEPLLHQTQPGWIRLLNILSSQGKQIEVETNGTVVPTDLTAHRVTRLNVSPKLANSGEPEKRRIRPEALYALVMTGKAAFKFVCATPGDVDEAAAIVTAHRLPRGQVWIMPEGATPGTVLESLRAVADRTIAHRFRLTTRLHTLIWGDERGR